ncbi:alpha/beta hydrolase [Nocardioides bigeumensis]|uniref:Alpha/beta hydrolase n=1 Tax=Nocardioides bigeumensis TaxID=433657 RepID=A0ABP5JL95_9ACTN
MSARGRILGIAAGAAGIAAAGVAARVVRRGRQIRHRDDGDHLPFGSLRADPITVVADDGVPLYAEVDEVDESLTSTARDRRRDELTPTVVFVHGYALDLDCWHFQRAGYRGQVRTIFFDQRSHGRSGRSPDDHATIEQLGSDLERVLDDLTGDEPVVLVGHSMGGMTVMSLAERRPDLFGTKVVGAALIATTAGGLDPGRILFPLLPAGIGPGIVTRVVSTLSRGSGMVDRVRAVGRDVARVVVDTYAFGSAVPASYVDFTYDMLDKTPFSVVADFFPAFASLDHWTHLEPFERVPTSIICGTKDKITGVHHSRKLHESIAGSELLQCRDAGHMVVLESHREVNAELDDLLERAVERLAQEQVQ